MILTTINKIVSRILVVVSNWRTLRKFQNTYGTFLFLRDSDSYSFPLSNESCKLYGEVVKMVTDLAIKPEKVLLPGENNISKEQIKAGLVEKLGESKIVTVGLSNNIDHRWDFEDTPPQIGRYSLIISQAMLEHLVDPYKHMVDLANYLEKGGHLIVHTELPGFMYHRHPVDTLRFHPDWFEEIARPKRCNLKVISRYIRDFHIFYMYEKQ